MQLISRKIGFLSRSPGIVILPLSSYKFTKDHTLVTLHSKKVKTGSSRRMLDKVNENNIN